MWRNKLEPKPSSEESAAATPGVFAPEPADRAPVGREAHGTRLSKGIRVKGEITGNEDMVINGELEGSVRLQNASLTVGPTGNVTADVAARHVEIHGKMKGRVEAAERVVIGRTGALAGDVITQRIAIEDGALLRGSVDIVRPGATRPAPAGKAVAAAVAPSPASPVAALASDREENE